MIQTIYSIRLSCCFFFFFRESRVGCCKPGSFCYSTGCCPNGDSGCQGNSCCSPNQTCCTGGGCCDPGCVSNRKKKGYAWFPLIPPGVDTIASWLVVNPGAARTAALAITPLNVPTLVTFFALERTSAAVCPSILLVPNPDYLI